MTKIAAERVKKNKGKRNNIWEIISEEESCRISNVHIARNRRTHDYLMFPISAVFFLIDPQVGLRTDSEQEPVSIFTVDLNIGSCCVVALKLSLPTFRHGMPTVDTGKTPTLQHAFLPLLSQGPPGSAR